MLLLITLVFQYYLINFPKNIKKFPKILRYIILKIKIKYEQKCSDKLNIHKIFYETQYIIFNKRIKRQINNK